MGKLTKDMRRLRGEIQGLREGRQALREGLAEGNRERQKEVVEMCANFAGALAHKVGRARDKRLAALNNLKHAVGELQRVIRADLAVVRRVWAARGA